MDYQFELINQDNFNQYQKFTFPRYRHAFSGPDLKERYFGIGIFEERTPLGLILGQLDSKYPHKMDILSVFVIADYRKKGLATMLFYQFEAEVKRQGFKSITIKYIDNRESIQYIEKILARLGWYQPEVNDYIYKCRIADFKHDWFGRFQLKKSFSICDLTGLTGMERSYLRKGCGVWYPKGLSPFAEEEKIIPEMTLFLKHQGEIIGWFSVFQASVETLAYRSVFVKQKFQGTGVMIPLMVKVSRIHLKAMERYPYAAFQVSVTNRKMEKIIKKSVKEFISITGMLFSYKKLKEE